MTAYNSSVLFSPDSDNVTIWSSNLLETTTSVFVPVSGSTGLSGQNQSYQINLEHTSVIHISLACLSTFANLVILVTICVDKNLRKRTNILITNLCLASVAYETLYLLRTFDAQSGWKFTYNSNLCGILAFAQRLPFPVMSMSTMFLSLERSQSATAMIPFQHFPSRALATFKICTIWIIAILITLPTAFVNVYDPSSATRNLARKCSKVLLANNAPAHMIYVVIHMVVVHLAPTIVLIAELMRMRAKINFLIFRQPEVNCGTGADERLRLVRNACLFAALFIICWLPIGLTLSVYDLPSEIVPLKWKLNSGVTTTISSVFLVTNYFIFSIPIQLFVISQRLRDSVSSGLGHIIHCCRSYCCCWFCPRSQRRQRSTSCDDESSENRTVDYYMSCTWCSCWEAGDLTSEAGREGEGIELSQIY